MSKRKAHSFYAGKPASKHVPSSRVRVFTRPDRPDLVIMARAWVRTESGRVVEEPLPAGTTWEKAVILCELTAAERRKHILEGRVTEGKDKPPTTLSELIDAHLEAMRPRWKKRYAEDNERNAKFWILHLGPGRIVEDLSHNDIEGTARKYAKTPRTQRSRIAYLRAACRWGKRRAKMLKTNPAEGIEMPEYIPDTTELVYTSAEVSRLCQPHPEIDWRVTLAVNIATDTGRRISAIRNLATGDVIQDGDAMLLKFQAANDKKGRARIVPISEVTRSLVLAALERPIVDEHGWLFPEGRLEYNDPRDKPRSREAMARDLHHAERILGIEHIRGRGYHGIKRRHVTAAFQVSGGDASLVGDVTGNTSTELLRNVYRQQDHRRIKHQVDSVRTAITGGVDTQPDTQVNEADNDE